jgi:hypothetical protein
MSVVHLDVCGSFVLVFVLWFVRLPLFGRHLHSVVRLFESTKPLFIFCVFEAFWHCREYSRRSLGAGRHVGSVSGILPTRFGWRAACRECCREYYRRTWGGGRHVGRVVGHNPDAVCIPPHKRFYTMVNCLHRINSMVSILSVTRYRVQDTEILGARTAVVFMLLSFRHIWGFI